MVTLEQVKLLETKVAKAIDFVKQVTEENNALKGKVDSYEKRIDELEILIRHFKEDQGRIEDGILSALDRLNQFEDAIEKSLSPVRPRPKPEEKPILKQEPKAVPPEETPEGEEDLDPLWQDIPPRAEEPKLNDELLFGEEPETGSAKTGEDDPGVEAQDDAELDIF
jgi:FtsZ-binding cell division protein ZapB